MIVPNSTSSLTSHNATAVNDENEVDIHQLKEMISQLQHSVAHLEANQLKVENESKNLFDRFQKIAHRLEWEHKKNLKQHEAINFARLKVIEQQEKELRLYKIASWRHLIKFFFRPSLGVLHQHKAKPLNIPLRYRRQINVDNFPMISIVTPSFNQGHFLEKTILSILDQHYPALEYVIQDGGSKDSSVEIIERYQSSLKYWESKKDKGQSNALNQGFQKTNGEIMAYLNSDDMLMPNTLHYVANYFNMHPEVDVVYGHRIIIDEYDQEIGRWILPPHNSDVLTWADYIPQETLFWRRRIWDKAGGNINEAFQFAMDWDLILRFKKANAVFARLPRFLGAFRVHIHQKTSEQIVQVGEKEMERLRTRCHGKSVSPEEIRRNIRGYQIWSILYQKLYALGLLRY